MTEISKLVAAINMCPQRIPEIDWYVETNEFSKRRIKQILKELTDAELRKIVSDYIVDGWYDACEENCDFLNLKDVVGYDEIYGCDIMEYRFHPKRKKTTIVIDGERIEDYIQEQLMLCAENDEREQQLKRLQMKADRDIAAISSFCEMNEEAEGYISKLAAETILKDMKDFELEECSKSCPKIIEAKHQARVEAVRKLVEGLIIFAEQYTADQNDKAEVIRLALSEKLISEYIPQETFTPELKSRLEKLGRKEKVTIMETLNHNYASGSIHKDYSRHLNVQELASSTNKQIGNL